MKKVTSCTSSTASDFFKLFKVILPIRNFRKFLRALHFAVGIYFACARKLPSKMGEGFVGFCHFVSILALLHSLTFILESSHKFISKLLSHRLTLL